MNEDKTIIINDDDEKTAFIEYMFTAMTTYLVANDLVNDFEENFMNLYNDFLETIGEHMTEFDEAKIKEFFNRDRVVV